MSNELSLKIIEILNSINVNLNSDLAKWNFWVLVLTLVVLILYTIFTYGILKENKKIREKEFMPFLFLDGHNLGLSGKGDKSFQGVLAITNIGQGIGFNITADNIFINGYELRFKQVIQRLLPNSNRAEMTSITNKTEKKTNSNKVILRCSDQLGNKYYFEYDISFLHIQPSFIRMKNYKYFG